jgi:hypothetical protein
MKDETLKEREDGIFRLAEGVLYRINTMGKDGKNLLVAPSVPRRDIVKTCHDAPTGGHFGIEKTWAKLNERY